MAKDNKIQMPGAFGGLMRYDEEFTSKFNLTPTHVIMFITFVVMLRFALPLFKPLI